MLLNFNDMVIRKCILSFSLLILIGKSFSQDVDLYAGVNTIPERVNKNYLGANFGLLTAFHSKSRIINFQTGIHFDLFREALAVFSPPNFPGADRSVGQFSFLTIPMHLRIKVSGDKHPNQRLYWRIGYDYGILLQSKRTMHYEDGIKTVNYLHRFFESRNFLHHNGLTFGFQYERNWLEKHRIGINAHYRYHFYSNTFQITDDFGSFNFGLNYGLFTNSKKQSIREKVDFEGK